MKTVLALILFLPFLVKAQLIQILYTNDIHGNVEQYKGFENRGGYGRIKHIIDSYKAKAEQDGYETITLDGGDFLEGNISYLADSANKLMGIHNSIGYDAVVMGNHDYLMGGNSLKQLFRKTPPNFALLAANLKFKKRHRELDNTIRPYTILRRSGLNIGIIGVTTNELFYTFRLDEAKFKSPYNVANKLAEELKEKVDLTIALTHLGYSRDKKLAGLSTHIDLIVGAHSHTTLEKATYVRSNSGFKIPIVQSGSEGRYVGRILLDVQKDHKIKMLDYELINTYKAQRDAEIENQVNDLRDSLEKEFGKKWLTESIGYSDLSYDRYYESKHAWGVYIANTLKQVAGADIGVHATEFAGGMFPVGEVTREEVFNSYPRVFDMHQRKGWKVYKFNIRGWLLKPIVKILYRYNDSVFLSGVSMKFKKKKNGQLKIKKVYINGKKLNPFKKYTFSVPEGIVKGAMGISKILTGILTNKIKETPIYVWDSLNQGIKNSISINSDAILKQKTSYTVIEK